MHPAKRLAGGAPGRRFKTSWGPPRPISSESDDEEIREQDLQIEELSLRLRGPEPWRCGVIQQDGANSSGRDVLKNAGSTTNFSVRFSRHTVTLSCTTPPTSQELFERRFLHDNSPRLERDKKRHNIFCGNNTYTNTMPPSASHKSPRTTSCRSSLQEASKMLFLTTYPEPYGAVWYFNAGGIGPTYWRRAHELPTTILEDAGTRSCQSIAWNTSWLITCESGRDFSRCAEVLTVTCDGNVVLRFIDKKCFLRGVEQAEEAEDDGRAIALVLSALAKHEHEFPTYAKLLAVNGEKDICVRTPVEARRVGDMLARAAQSPNNVVLEVTRLLPDRKKAAERDGLCDRYASCIEPSTGMLQMHRDFCDEGSDYTKSANIALSSNNEQHTECHLWPQRKAVSIHTSPTVSGRINDRHSLPRLRHQTAPLPDDSQNHDNKLILFNFCDAILGVCDEEARSVAKAILGNYLASSNSIVHFCERLVSHRLGLFQHGGIGLRYPQLQEEFGPGIRRFHEFLDRHTAVERQKLRKDAGGAATTDCKHQMNPVLPKEAAGAALEELPKLAVPTECEHPLPTEAATATSHEPGRPGCFDTPRKSSSRKESGSTTPSSSEESDFSFPGGRVMAKVESEQGGSDAAVAHGGLVAPRARGLTGNLRAGGGGGASTTATGTFQNHPVVGTTTLLTEDAATTVVGANGNSSKVVPLRTQQPPACTSPRPPPIGFTDDQFFKKVTQHGGANDVFEDDGARRNAEIDGSKEAQENMRMQSSCWNQAALVKYRQAMKYPRAEAAGVEEVPAGSCRQEETCRNSKMENSDARSAKVERAATMRGTNSASPPSDLLLTVGYSVPNAVKRVVLGCQIFLFLQRCADCFPDHLHPEQVLPDFVAHIKPWVSELLPFWEANGYEDVYLLMAFADPHWKGIAVRAGLPLRFPYHLDAFGKNTTALPSHERDAASGGKDEIQIRQHYNRSSKSDPDGMATSGGDAGASTYRSPETGAGNMATCRRRSSEVVVQPDINLETKSGGGNTLRHPRYTTRDEAVTLQVYQERAEWRKILQYCQDQGYEGRLGPRSARELQAFMEKLPGTSVSLHRPPRVTAREYRFLFEKFRQRMKGVDQNVVISPGTRPPRGTNILNHEDVHMPNEKITDEDHARVARERVQEWLAEVAKMGLKKKVLTTELLEREVRLAEQRGDVEAARKFSTSGTKAPMAHATMTQGVVTLASPTSMVDETKSSKLPPPTDPLPPEQGNLTSWTSRGNADETQINTPGAAQRAASARPRWTNKNYIWSVYEALQPKFAQLICLRRRKVSLQVALEIYDGDRTICSYSELLKLPEIVGGCSTFVADLKDYYTRHLQNPSEQVSSTSGTTDKDSPHLRMKSKVSTTENQSKSPAASNSGLEEATVLWNAFSSRDEGKLEQLRGRMEGPFREKLLEYYPWESRSVEPRSAHAGVGSSALKQVEPASSSTLVTPSREPLLREGTRDSQPTAEEEPLLPSSPLSLSRNAELVHPDSFVVRSPACVSGIYVRSWPHRKTVYVSRRHCIVGELVRDNFGTTTQSSCPRTPSTARLFKWSVLALDETSSRAASDPFLTTPQEVDQVLFPTTSGGAATRRPGGTGGEMSTTSGESHGGAGVEAGPRRDEPCKNYVHVLYTKSIPSAAPFTAELPDMIGNDCRGQHQNSWQRHCIYSKRSGGRARSGSPSASTRFLDEQFTFECVNQVSLRAIARTSTGLRQSDRQDDEHSPCAFSLPHVAVQFNIAVKNVRAAVAELRDFLGESELRENEPTADHMKMPVTSLGPVLERAHADLGRTTGQAGQTWRGEDFPCTRVEQRRELVALLERVFRSDRNPWRKGAYESLTRRGNFLQDREAEK
ncbi:unnamed protein product [Amoebophrya sp. A120]|nr:unnamed protein product [Amoebophrya sp. A120]|eukprot:GSA120T00025151001.1